MSREGQDPGRTYKSFLLVAKDSANVMVKMRGWEGKGRYLLMSKGKSRAMNGDRAGEAGLSSRKVYRRGLEKSAWKHTC